MNAPYLLCAGACAAAALAAYIGHLASPTMRSRRAQRRRWARLSAHRMTVAGQLARDPDLWERWWTEHQLDDVLRGGA
ncbi:hypothetical protein MF672_039030 [Actinomadura sp. ATCC 31491]|uniref:Uncharacterized protein n=1 Tax=Actinomadura luzonensis TaxID=2805427 RepID=A0ABT0G5F7_9ACTN|nr:hypothetical protein [Actinomadura luzonensis]MCK2219749.1 hypothetical protein [Actinomadura luzonensis]